jgi:DNA-binding NarL/FixJ family response regulator
VRSINVWIVDDDLRYCKMVFEIIRRFKTIQCTRCFSDISSISASLQVEKYLPDVVLLDIVLIGKSGLEAIEKIKRLSPKSRIIVLTNCDEDPFVFRAFGEGVQGFLLKDTSTAELQTAIQAVHAGLATIDERVLIKLGKLLTGQGRFVERVELTGREKEMLHLLSKGYGRRDISEHLSLSYLTVETHFKHLHAKLKVRSDVQLLLVILGLSPIQSPNTHYLRFGDQDK